MQRRAAAAVLAAASLLLASGCSSGDGGTPGADRSTSPGRTAPGSSSSGKTAEATPPAKGSVKVVRTVAQGLKTPWGLAPLPDGDLLVTSRDDGTITRIDEKTGKKTELGSVPGVSAAGEGGLLGIALSPSYASDHMIYAYFTTASDNRIARLLHEEHKPSGEQLGAPDTVFKGIPKGFIHNGGRIAFGPDNMLYAGTGESGNRGLAQDKKSLGGKILRMTPEGEPAPGNPFGDSVVYSYGHRNVQGLAWDDKQRLFAAEFGQDTWDELNAIKPGGNYGWPDAEGRSGDAKYRDPIAQWHTAEASPSGIAYAEGSLWMAGLRGQRLWRVPLKGTEASAAPQAFLKGTYGRLRTVVPAGDGKLWVTTSETDGRGTPGKGDDRILELQVT
ncbi:glucose sorbosone dehydrogenase [Streptomyces avermitilis]|uniref:Oxidoreductase n=2 Tax=Streptomyces avermitilis TaxID=33903 RepID=Q82JL8_STRAW|nr:PQQ-dependent sugar dehydrogenase [Streptomyces avermitilis]MYS98338.1 PQQ-dependent sugar dehydrogenase [Streptomyces sp. SID5469]KUN51367.1 glucose sorbosone dehydrogenase [Streptomyces avermitilis]OOV33261.1 glucose sorbosone dehydrogenase [Streptomyces avermitilis]BAC70448.1 putative oxidoreductase [Streptomyces avermitilis MA-4680 = NBRC 14893]BBJ50551.1 oxidoreductase [Streptomyces avermitilis]